MSEYKKRALVLGAGGFIGSHMVKRLREEGYWVRGVDLKQPEFTSTHANEFITGDLRDVDFVRVVFVSLDTLVISSNRLLRSLHNLLMRSISSLLIWVAQVSFSLARTMRTLCITPYLLI